MRRGTKIKAKSLGRKVEVDVSGQIGDTKLTVFAFSNSINRSILVPARVKRLAQKYFRLIQADVTHESFYFIFYISGLVILLKPFLQEISDLILDTELSGQDDKVRQALSEELTGFGRNRIGFRQIGRESRAHLLAKTVFSGGKPDKIVTIEELKRFLGNKKRSATPKVKLRTR